MIAEGRRRDTHDSARDDEATIQCLPGCDLSWVQRGLNRNASATPAFTFNCRGAGRCGSRTVGGWIRRQDGKKVVHRLVNDHPAVVDAAKAALTVVGK
jgi:hypothetical protein